MYKHPHRCKKFTIKLYLMCKIALVCSYRYRCIYSQLSNNIKLLETHKFIIRLQKLIRLET